MISEKRVLIANVQGHKAGELVEVGEKDDLLRRFSRPVTTPTQERLAQQVSGRALSASRWAPNPITIVERTKPRIRDAFRAFAPNGQDKPVVAGEWDCPRCGKHAMVRVKIADGRDVGYCPPPCKVVLPIDLLEGVYAKKKEDAPKA